MLLNLFYHHNYILFFIPGPLFKAIEYNTIYQSRLILGRILRIYIMWWKIWSNILKFKGWYFYWTYCFYLFFTNYLHRNCVNILHYVLLILTLPHWLLKRVKYLKKEYKDEQNILNTIQLYVCIKIPFIKKNREWI